MRLELLYPFPKRVCKPLHLILHMEPVTGIEPAYPLWKSGVLPLNYTDVVPNQNFTGAAIADGVLREYRYNLKGFLRRFLMNHRRAWATLPCKAQSRSRLYFLHRAITQKHDGLSLCLPKYSSILQVNPEHPYLNVQIRVNYRA